MGAKRGRVEADAKVSRMIVLNIFVLLENIRGEEDWTLSRLARWARQRTEKTVDGTPPQTAGQT